MRSWTIRSIPRPRDKSRCTSNEIVDTIACFLMFRSHRAVLYCGCFFFSLVLAGSLAGQLATGPTLTNPPAQTAPAASTASSPPPINEAQPVAPEVRRLHYELKLDLRGAY